MVNKSNVAGDVRTGWYIFTDLQQSQCNYAEMNNPFVFSQIRRFAHSQIWPKLDVDTDTDTDVQTDTDIDLEFIVMGEEELERPYRVIIHNDDVTTFEFVINILVVVFEQTFFRATRIAFETHYKGNSYVATLPLEEAKSKVFKAQFAARKQGFPLTFSIEPE